MLGLLKNTCPETLLSNPNVEIGKKITIIKKQLASY